MSTIEMKPTMLIPGDRQVLGADIVASCGWEVRQVADMRLASPYACIHTHLVKPVTPTNAEEYLRMTTSRDEVLE